MTGLAGEADGAGAMEVTGATLLLADGHGVSQATQRTLSFELVTQQTEHVHESAAGLKRSPNPIDVAGRGAG